MIKYRKTACRQNIERAEKENIMLILVCNAGSTSLKYKLFAMPEETVLAEGRMERIGRNDAIFTFVNCMNGFRERTEGLSIPDYTSGVQMFLNSLLDAEKGCLTEIGQLDAVGFKTVLAKGYYGVHELTEDVIRAMEEYSAVAPAHNPPYIQAIRVFRSLIPDCLMVGCFETAFHRTIPLSRKLYAVPYEWYERYGIQRFGYHGASHGYIASQVEEMAGKDCRLISCHMGGSGSICAILNGESMDTSFGFSLQTGLPHANRSGDMDAYIIPYLLGLGMPLEGILRGIDKRGGLLGISGVSNDLREIQEAADRGNERAELAIDIYCEAAVRYIGGFYTELGGMDYLVFTGGIGENSFAVREKICSKLACLGVVLDREKNSTVSGRAEISAMDSKVKVYVIPANEELGIAKTIWREFKEN